MDSERMVAGISCHRGWEAKNGLFVFRKFAFVFVVFFVAQIQQQGLQEIFEGWDGPGIDFPATVFRVKLNWFRCWWNICYYCRARGCSVNTLSDSCCFAGDFSKVSHDAWHPGPPRQRYIDKAISPWRVISLFVGIDTRIICFAVAVATVAIYR